MLKRLLVAVLSGGLLLGVYGTVWAMASAEEEPAYILYWVNDGRLEEAGSYLPQQIDRPRAERIWQIFTAIVPGKQLARVHEYYVSGPENEGGASVIAIDGKLREWQLSIDEKSVDLQNRLDIENLVFVLVHELGHIITLNNEQIEVDYTVCENRIELEEGCAREGSYINQFVREFWTPQMVSEAEEESAEVLHSRYRGHFLAEYAATNPAEDIAESFSIFVEEEQPEDCQVSIAEQKICFFYGFPELIILRSQIRAGVADL
ncbi:hypothetical protein [Aliamphritea spongicola]|uniref:hypothetical protein n=1 Tax=Aliamphritea spongicola TaxID=707589 RepID=UPI00196B70DD|nr:hypothetical protein [Aliamphritea spongicola]MBN3563675.1 hypothetical protein [Aliamphritea spongicola]